MPKSQDMHDIHLTPEERHAKKMADLAITANNELRGLKSEIGGQLGANNEAIKALERGLGSKINAPEVVVRKLEEVKSATLASNIKLKQAVERLAKSEDVLMTIARAVSREPEKRPEVQKISIDGFSGTILKGDKGIDGKTPTKDELVKLIKPLIPTPIAGHTPTDRELLDLIRPLIPKVKDGQTPTDKELLAIIKPLIPKVRDGVDGKDGSPDSPEEVRDKLQTLKGRNRLDASAIKGLPALAQKVNELGAGTIERGTAYGENSLIIQDEGSKISEIVNVIDFVGAGVSADYSGSGKVTVTVAAAGINVETPTGAVDGSNLTYTVANEPRFVIMDGMFRVDGFGYTYAGGTITVDSTGAPTQFIRSYY